MVLSNPWVAVVVERLPQLGLPDCWLTAGALFQTVWNCLSAREPWAGIRDYDVNYFRPDRSVLGRRGPGDPRGVPCPPYTSTASAGASFPNASSCFAVRLAGAGLEVFAPKGFSDLFAMRAVPNPVLAPRAVYEAKTARWQREWPQLTVQPWP